MTWRNVNQSLEKMSYATHNLKVVPMSAYTFWNLVSLTRWRMYFCGFGSAIFFSIVQKGNELFCHIIGHMSSFDEGGSGIVQSSKWRRRFFRLLRIFCLERKKWENPMKKTTFCCCISLCISWLLSCVEPEITTILVAFLKNLLVLEKEPIIFIFQKNKHFPIRIPRITFDTMTKSENCHICSRKKTMSWEHGNLTKKECGCPLDKVQTWVGFPFQEISRNWWLSSANRSSKFPLKMYWKKFWKINW